VRTDHVDKHLEQKKTTCEKEKNQKRKTLAKKERRVSQRLELMWVVGKKGITIVRLKIETIESMTKQVTSCGAGSCTLTDNESEWGWFVHGDQRIGRR